MEKLLIVLGGLLAVGAAAALAAFCLARRWRGAHRAIRAGMRMPQLTASEQAALRHEEQLLAGAKANAALSGFADTLPSADFRPLSSLQYWSLLQTPTATARIKQAIERGDDVNEADEFGHRPLHGAADNACIDNLKLLLAAGADPTAQAADGSTPLDLAVAAGHAEVIALLRAATPGADEAGPEAAHRPSG